jgi:hypothetical protein
MTSLARFIDAIHKPGWPVALMGAMALAAWGVVRATADIDWLVGAPTSRAFADWAETLAQQGFAVQHRPSAVGDPLGDVVEATGEDFECQCIMATHVHEWRALDRAKPYRFQGTAVSVITIEDLMLLKCYAGGPQDWEDIRRLLDRHRGGLDVTYLRGCLADPALRDCSADLVRLLGLDAL